MGDYYYPCTCGGTYQCTAYACLADFVIDDRPPYFSQALTTQTIFANRTTLYYLPHIVDPNSTLPCTTINVSSPPWATLSGNTYTFSPDETITGYFQITLNISDGVNFPTYNFNVTVMPPNNLPAFRQPLVNQTMKEGH